MKPTLTSKCTALLLCLCVLLFPKPARADSLGTAVTEVFVGVIAVTAAITIAIVYTVRHDPSIKGCATSSPNGLTLTDQGSQETFLLTGDIVALKPGDLIKVTGKRRRKMLSALVPLSLINSKRITAPAKFRLDPFKTTSGPPRRRLSATRLLRA